MLTNNEYKLLNATNSDFPLLKAAKSVWMRCGKCNHANISVNTTLNLAVSAYKNNPMFIKFCSTLFALPTRIGNIMIGEKNG